MMMFFVEWRFTVLSSSDGRVYTNTDGAQVPISEITPGRCQWEPATAVSNKQAPLPHLFRDVFGTNCLCLQTIALCRTARRRGAFARRTRAAALSLRRALAARSAALSSVHHARR